MENLYEKCREVVINSTSCCDEDIIEYLTISFMALYLLKGHLILDKLPAIIEKTEFSRNDKKKIDLNIFVLCKEDGNDTKNILSFPEDTDDLPFYSIIENVVYFLTSLLRIKDVKNCGQYIEFKAGISSKKVYLDGTTMMGRGSFIEKGIINIVTKDAMILLREYLSDNYDNAISNEHYSDLIGSRCFTYDLRIYLLEKLLEDERFKELVDASFTNIDDKKFGKYYNEIMDNDAAYARLNKLFSDLTTALFDHDEARITSIAEIFYEEVDVFKKKKKQFNKNI